MHDGKLFPSIRNLLSIIEYPSLYVVHGIGMINQCVLVTEHAARYLDSWCGVITIISHDYRGVSHSVYLHMDGKQYCAMVVPW